MQTMMLNELSNNVDARVQTIDDANLAQRMLMFGVRVGTLLRVVQHSKTRGVVILVGGSRVALGKEAVDVIRVCVD